MRKIRIIEQISLDGVIQAPGGRGEDGDYAHGGWAMPYFDTSIGEAIRKLENWKIGGAVGVLPPESEKPDQSFLQAQLRILLTRTYSSKRGLPFAADSVSYTILESVDRASPNS